MSNVLGRTRAPHRSRLAGLALAVALPAALAAPAGAYDGQVVAADESETALYRSETAAPGLAMPNGPIPLLAPNLSAYDTRKDAAIAPGDDTQTSPLSEDADTASGPSTQVLLNLNQDGIAADGDSVPPDTIGAMGTSHYVEVVNDDIAVYRRADLGQQSAATLNSFLSAGSDDVFDPQVIWDPTTSRFYFTVIRRNVNFSTGRRTHYLAWGWSKTSDPSDLSSNGWCQFYSDTGTIMDDYPKLGDSDTHLVIGASMFRDGTPNGPDPTYASIGSRLRVIAKPPNGSTACDRPSVRKFGTASQPLTTPDDHATGTLVPVQSFSSSTRGWVVSADRPAASGSQIAVLAVTGDGSSLIKVGNIGVNDYADPPNAVQPLNTSGVGKRLDTLDARLTQAVGVTEPAVGKLAVWTQHTIKDTTHGLSAVRWYQLIPGDKVRRQSNTIRNSKRFILNGAISAAANGTTAVVHYNVVGRGRAPQIKARSRRADTPLNHMGPALLLASSSAAAQDFSCYDERPACRWGDYASAVPDPAPGQENVVWGSNQYQGTPSGQDPRWRTRNFALTPVLTP